MEVVRSAACGPVDHRLCTPPMHLSSTISDGAKTQNSRYADARSVLDFRSLREVKSQVLFISARRKADPASARSNHDGLRSFQNAKQICTVWLSQEDSRFLGTLAFSENFAVFLVLAISFLLCFSV